MTREKSFEDFRKNQNNPPPLFFAACLVALAFRFINLGAPALMDMEAAIALEAHSVAEGISPVFSENIGYVGLTSVTFFLFTATNLWARFWPAMIGSLVVFIPFLFRKWLGHYAAIVLAFGLAISPELVGLSRIVGSPMIAMVCFFFGIAFFFHRMPIFLGVSLALGMMSGSSFWVGGLIFGLSYLLSTKNLKVSETLRYQTIGERAKFLDNVGVSFGLTILIIGTNFFREPAGLTGVFSGLIEFLGGFGKGYTQPYGLLPLVLITYMAPALFFSLLGSVRGIIRKSKKELFLLSWFLLGLVIIFIFPGRQPADIMWVSLPLWAMAARLISQVSQTWHYSRKIIIFTAILTIVSSAFLVLSLRALVNITAQNVNWLNPLVAIFAGIALIAAILLLVRFGWSGEVAFAGLIMGAVVVLGVTSISFTVNSTGINPIPHHEIWYPQQTYQTPEWMMATINRVMEWNASGSDPVEIAVVENDTPAMRWILRDLQPVSFVPFLPPQSQVGMIISNDQTIPEIAESYRGQELVINRTVPWQGLTANQYLRWWMTRDVPTIPNQAIIWVRTDLMPDAQFLP